MEKARPTDLAARIREIQSDPSNPMVPRVGDAGKVVGDYLVTHNGLRVHPMNSFYMGLLQANGGCHEPQEEFLFQRVLEHIPNGATMLELGSYWAFYSMWFAKAIPQAKCYMVEPDPSGLDLGRRNFELNGLTGHFSQGKVGHGHLRIQDFLDQHQIQFLDLLHADVQCAEFEMLCDAEIAFRSGRIGHIFIGTHGQDLHYRCKEFLENHNYTIIAHADWFHGTFCQDGIIVARSNRVAGLAPIDIPLRQPHQPYVIGSSSETHDTQMEREQSRRPLKRVKRWVGAKLHNVFNSIRPRKAG